ncbi:MAG TPA: Rpn family recombination-promoting nuclease/putative transposase [Leptospiraceae bacterium]|nr:Rpn family recombination-promoting nuclease/putative transposase [Leptospiraceae bacterium]
MEDRKPRYMNPYTDFGFKRLFGVEANKDLLIDFLNQVLPPEHNIENLQFRNPENHSDLPFLRKAIFDIQCRGRNGENIIIEMQKEKIQFFKDRSLFAVTFPIQEQAKKDRWDFKLSHIYLIAVLDFEYDEREEQRKFERYVQLKDQDGDLFYSKLHFKFLQMPLFTKTESELKTRFDKWCYFLKNLESFNEIPAILNEPIFERAFRTSEVSAMSREEYDIYMESLMSYWESQGMLETARAEAEIKGRNEGRIEGKIEGKEEVALNGIRLGLSDNTIQELTGLSADEIKKLRER